jgi:hypothetical protein
MGVHKKRWVGVGVGALGVAAAIIIACSASHELIGHSGNDLQVSGIVPGTVTDGSTGQAPGYEGTFLNVTAAWSQNFQSDSGSMFVVGAQGLFYPDAGLVATSTGPNMMSWWSSSVANTTPYSNVCTPTLAGCAECNQTTLLPSGTINFMGNPYIAADGLGDVVYVGEVDTDGNPNNGAEMIIALVSGDGGQHFDQAQWVNDDPHNGCNQGHQRMPHVTFDTTTSLPTVWVAWGNNNAGNYGGCIRHGTIINGVRNVGGCNQLNFTTINWITNPDGASSESVSNMKQSCSGVCSVGQGSLMVQAGDGAVTVMYSGNDSAPTIAGGVMGCPGGINAHTTNMGWGTVTSNDNGHSWSTDPWIFNEPNANTYVWCQGGTTHTAFVGLRDYGFTRASNGHLYAALHTAIDTIRVWESDDKGHHWREWCPGNVNNQPDGGPFTTGTEIQTSPWLETTYLCPNIVGADAGGIAANGGQTNTEVLWPTLASDGDMVPVTVTDAGLHVVGPQVVAQQKSRVVLTYNQSTTENDGGANIPYTQVYQSNSDPASPATNTDTFQSLKTISINEQFMTGMLPPLPPQLPNLMGQYHNIAVQPATVPCVENIGQDAASFNPTIQCNASIFWPYWVECLGGACFQPPSFPLPNVVTRSIVMTNPP